MLLSFRHRFDVRPRHFVQETGLVEVINSKLEAWRTLRSEHEVAPLILQVDTRSFVVFAEIRSFNLSPLTETVELDTGNQVFSLVLGESLALLLSLAFTLLLLSLLHWLTREMHHGRRRRHLRFMVEEKHNFRAVSDTRILQKLVHVAQVFVLVLENDSRSLEHTIRVVDHLVTNVLNRGVVLRARALVRLGFTSRLGFTRSPSPRARVTYRHAKRPFRRRLSPVDPFHDDGKLVVIGVILRKVVHVVRLSLARRQRTGGSLGGSLSNSLRTREKIPLRQSTTPF